MSFGFLFSAFYVKAMHRQANRLMIEKFKNESLVNDTPEQVCWKLIKKKHVFEECVYKFYSNMFENVVGCTEASSIDP